MHILQLYKDYFPVLGGIENHVRDLSEGLAARGHQVTVLVTSLDGRTSVEQPLAGLTVIRAARCRTTRPSGSSWSRPARRARP